LTVKQGVYWTTTESGTWRKPLLRPVKQRGGWRKTSVEQHLFNHEQGTNKEDAERQDSKKLVQTGASVRKKHGLKRETFVSEAVEEKLDKTS